MTKSLISSKNDALFLDRVIRTYLENRPLFYAFIRPQEALLFHQHQALIKPSILDFGCGDGFFAHTVFGPKSIDIGLDVSTSRIAETKMWPAYKKTVVYDGQKIPFPDNHFQTVISNCVFEHLPHLQQNLTEIYRVLKPGGYLLTTVMTNIWEENLLGAKLFGNSYRRYLRNKQQHPNLYSQFEWHKTLSGVGFAYQKQIGYEGDKTSKWNEITHYLSFPSLLSYKLFHRWVIYPSWHKPLNFTTKLKYTIIPDINVPNPGALFLVLKKP